MDKLCLRKYHSPFFIVRRPDAICMHAALMDGWMRDAKVDLYIELYLYITYIELVNASLNRWEHSHIIARYHKVVVVLICPLASSRFISLFSLDCFIEDAGGLAYMTCKVWKVYCVGWGNNASDQNVWLDISVVWGRFWNSINAAADNATTLVICGAHSQ